MMAEGIGPESKTPEWTFPGNDTDRNEQCRFVSVGGIENVGLSSTMSGEVTATSPHWKSCDVADGARTGRNVPSRVRSREKRGIESKGSIEGFGLSACGRSFGDRTTREKKKSSLLIRGGTGLCWGALDGQVRGVGWNRVLEGLEG